MSICVILRHLAPAALLFYVLPSHAQYVVPCASYGETVTEGFALDSHYAIQRSQTEPTISLSAVVFRYKKLRYVASESRTTGPHVLVECVPHRVVYPVLFRHECGCPISRLFLARCGKSHKLPPNVSSFALFWRIARKGPRSSHISPKQARYPISCTRLYPTAACAASLRKAA